MMPSGVEHLDCSRIAQDLQIRKVQVESVVQLLDEGNTVPFITRYRKERTGGLNEDIIRRIQARLIQLRQLAERKQTILKSIDGQGKLSDELRAAIMAADTPKRLEDLYLPYKPKRTSKAAVAREKGLEPLALAVWNRDPAVANLTELLPTLVNPEKGLNTPAEVLDGVQHILAEQIADTADLRGAIRLLLWDSARLCTSKNENLPEGQGLEYKDYFQFTEPIRHIPPHRILAINRGEKEGPLKVRVEWDPERVRRVLLDKLPLADHPHAEFLKTVTEDALNRLLLPSLEREIRRELTERAQDHAVSVFARNLRSLLLQPPLRGRRVLAIDPGFRTGCKVAALDEGGNLLAETVIFPHALHGSPHGKKASPPPPPPAPAAVASPEAPPAPAPEKKEEPTTPAPRKGEARAKLEELVCRHQLQVIAIGNGTACRETEEFVSDLLAELEKRRDLSVTSVHLAAPTAVPPTVVPASNGAESTPPADGTGTPPGEIQASAPPVEPLPPAPTDLAYVIVNEAGASFYSTSPVGREEFPDFDATLRGTISIGRRLQDPLSELVKIDPQNIGVGLYQHDVHPRHLKDSLEGVIESCVNHVGVDLNTASVPLLRHISGLNPMAARELVEYRKQHGPFRTREQLLQVPGIGPVKYVQAAGFLKIIGGDNPLDQTWIHPENYPAAQQLLNELGYAPEALADQSKSDELREKLKGLMPEEVSARLQLGLPTLRDILDALGRPGRDPRDDLPPPIFKKGILKLEQLQPGMELKGTVLNVVDFGAFVDIGLKDSGLVHISQMANRYIKSPYDVVAVGDVVTVWVLSVDSDRRRVSLTMIQPGTERKPPEKKPLPPRPARSQPPPRGRRPAPARAGASAGGPAPQSEGAPPTGPATTPAPGRRPSHPPPRPRKPPRAVPLPKLSQDALRGEVPLRTFRELEAFFKTSRDSEPTPSGQETPPAPESPSAVEASPPVQETSVSSTESAAP